MVVLIVQEATSLPLIQLICSVVEPQQALLQLPRPLPGLSSVLLPAVVVLKESKESRYEAILCLQLQYNNIMVAMQQQRMVGNPTTSILK
jgi:hypothetical protein